MFTFQEKEYDEEKLSPVGRLALSQLQTLEPHRDQLSVQIQNANVLINYYIEVMKKELEEEEKK